jgi:uncharacterized coiled-coil DUF342 family protein
MKSVFENKDFVNGFLDLYESEQFHRYIVPFVAEAIEQARTQLETSESVKELQGRIKGLKIIRDQALVLKQMISLPVVGEG